MWIATAVERVRLGAVVHPAASAMHAAAVANDLNTGCDMPYPPRVLGECGESYCAVQETDLRPDGPYRPTIPLDPTTVPPVVFEPDPAEQQAMLLTVEECAEVIQAVTKIGRFGEGRSPWKPEAETNLESLENELGDVQAMTQILGRLGVVDLARVAERAKVKIASLLAEPYRAPLVRGALEALDRRGARQGFES